MSRPATRLGDVLRGSGHVTVADELRRVGFAVPATPQKAHESGHKNSDRETNSPDQGKEKTMTESNGNVAATIISSAPTGDALPATGPAPVDAMRQAEGLLAQLQSLQALDAENVSAAAAAANAANEHAGVSADSAEKAAMHAGLASQSSAIANQHVDACAAFSKAVSEAAVTASGACDTISQIEQSVHTEFEGVAEMHSEIAETVRVAKKVTVWAGIGAGIMAFLGGSALIGVKVVAPRVRARRARRAAAIAAPPFETPVGEGTVTTS